MRKPWLGPVVVAVFFTVLGISILIGQYQLRSKHGPGSRATPPVPHSDRLKWKFRSAGPGVNCNTVAIGSDGVVYTTAGNQVLAVASGGFKRWTCDLVGELTSPALGANGTLYVVQNRESLCAVDPRGKVQWTYKFPDTVFVMPVLEPDGTVLVGCTDRTLYAIHPSGVLAWKYTGGEFFKSGPHLGSDGLLYFLDGQGSLIALSPQGQLHSKTKLLVEGADDLSGDPASGFAVSTLRGVALLNRDGSARWEFEARDPETHSRKSIYLRSEMAVRNDGAVFFGECDDCVYALSATGTLLWRYQVKDEVWGKPLLLDDGAIAILDTSGAFAILNMDGSVRWKKDLGPYATAHAAPVLGPRGIFYVSGGGELYALHSDGAEAWTYTTAIGGPFATTPLLAGDGTIYGLCLDSTLYALRPDGLLRWKTLIEGSGMFDPVFAADGKVLVPAGNKLCAVQPDGALAWKYDAGSTLWASPAVSSTGMIYIGAQDGRLLALIPGGGLLWAYQTPGEIMGCGPAISRSGVILIGTGLALDKPGQGPGASSMREDGTLYAIQPDGKLAWTFAAGSSIRSSPAVADDGTIYIASSMIWSGGVPDPNTPPPCGKLFALTTEGKEKWRCPVLDITQGKPALGRDGTVYICSYNSGYSSDAGISGQLFAISPAGKLLWQGPYGCLGSPRLGADGTLYSSGPDTKLHALSPSGAELWNYEIGPAVSGSPAIAPDGTLYSGSNDGLLYALRSE